MNQSARLRILVSGRDPDLVHSLARVLRLEGYAVVESTHDADAVNLANASKPDIVILDGSQSGGVELYRHLRQVCHQAAFLMTVGTEPALHSLRSRGFTVLRKPFEIDQLLATLETLGGGQGEVCLAS